MVFRNDGTSWFREATSSFFSSVPVVTALGLEFADVNGDSLIALYLCNRGDRDRFYIHTGAGVASLEEMMAPVAFTIDGNHPNPFTDATSIEYSLPRATPVEIAIFNMLGQRVATLLVTDLQSPGKHGVRWPAADAPPGLYYCRIITADGIRTKELIVD